jgi:hypothetical protein
MKNLSSKYLLFQAIEKKIQKWYSEIVNSANFETSKIYQILSFYVTKNIRCFKLRFCKFVEYTIINILDFSEIFEALKYYFQNFQKTGYM